MSDVLIKVEEQSQDLILSVSESSQDGLGLELDDQKITESDNVLIGEPEIEEAIEQETHTVESGDEVLEDCSIQDINVEEQPVEEVEVNDEQKTVGSTQVDSMKNDDPDLQDVIQNSNMNGGLNTTPEQIQIDLVTPSGQMLQSIVNAGDLVQPVLPQLATAPMSTMLPDSSTLSGQQVIVISNPQAVEPTSNIGIIEQPPTKKMLMQNEDGQTFIVQLPQDNDLLLNGNNVMASNLQNVLPNTYPNLSSAVTTVSMEGEVDNDTLLPEIGMETKDATETDVTQAWFTTRDDKQALHNKGFKWKQGQWSQDEIDLLQENINNYCRNLDIADPSLVIFEMTKDERKNFYRCVAKGLQRPLFSVYRRVVRMYDSKNHIGKYTAEEIDKLKELREKHGSDWAAIGAALGRSASSVKDRCRLMKETCYSGKWQEEEERRLVQAVTQLSGKKPSEAITTGLSWSSVAAIVKTRSEKQCRTKWLNYLNWKHRGGTDWTREDDLQLLNKIIALGLEEENQIDWKKLANGWASARSPQWLRGKWWTMKRHVRSYQNMPFPKILELLKTMHSNPNRAKPIPFKFEPMRVGYFNPTMTFAMPVPIGADTGSVDTNSFLTSAILSQNEDGIDASGLNLLQTPVVTTTSSALNSSQAQTGAYLLTQPQNNPAITFTGPNLGTDHIIVHTLPVPQLSSNNNVTVQMNPTVQSSVIISPSVDDSLATIGQISGDQSLHEGDALVKGSAEAESDHVIEGVDQFNSMEAIEEPDMVSGEVGAATELEMPTTASPNYSGVESDLMHLADPMLNSESSDLIGSSSDMEGDHKGQDGSRDDSSSNP